MPPLPPRKPPTIWLRSLLPDKKSTLLLKSKDKLLPSRPIRLTSSTSKNTMPTSRPPLLEKLLMLIPPGKPDTMPKRDSHSTPQERHGLPTCQTMLLRTQTSTSRPQLQLRRSWLMPPRLKRRPKRMPPHQLQPRLLSQLLLMLPQLPKPLHLSSNFTEAETLLKRESPTKQKVQNHQALAPLDHHPTPPHPPTE